MHSVKTSQSLVFTIVTAAATIPISYGRYIYPEEYNYLQHMNTPFNYGKYINFIYYGYTNTYYNLY